MNGKMHPLGSSHFVSSGEAACCRGQAITADITEPPFGHLSALPFCLDLDSAKHLKQVNSPIDVSGIIHMLNCSGTREHSAIICTGDLHCPLQQQTMSVCLPFPCHTFFCSGFLNLCYHSCCYRLSFLTLAVTVSLQDDLRIVNEDHNLVLKMTVAPRKENEFPFVLKNGMFGFCLVGIFFQNFLGTQSTLNSLLVVLTLILYFLPPPSPQKNLYAHI